jgi:hypothetical protein
MLHIFHAVVFYTVVLFPTTAQSLIFALQHVSATYIKQPQHYKGTQEGSCNTDTTSVSRFSTW